MKNLKSYRLAMACCVLLFLSSCAGVLYLGDTLPATSSVKVYYDAKDVKQSYKVIGHLAQAISGTPNMDDVKAKVIEKAKSIGADGVIFLQITAKPGSSNDAETINADAIKFDQ
jgi:hypothetical protein